MKILYLQNSFLGKEIEKALKNLGHKVIVLNEDADVQNIIDIANKSDLFLFHKGVKAEGHFDFQVTLARFQNILERIKCKKVLWFMERVWGLNEPYLDEIKSFVDKIYLTDGTFIRQNQEDFTFLPVGAELREGKYNKELECDVAFTGQIYGIRSFVFNSLKQKLGRKFRIFNNIWEQDFADLCATAKIIIAPKFTSNDFYWTNRIYQTLACGGFLIHPRLQGLIEEGFIAGEHYIDYSSIEDLEFAIESFLKPEAEEARKQIAKKGKEFVSQFTWEERLKTLLKA